MLPRHLLCARTPPVGTMGPFSLGSNSAYPGSSHHLHLVSFTPLSSFPSQHWALSEVGICSQKWILERASGQPSVARLESGSERPSSLKPSHNATLGILAEPLRSRDAEDAIPPQDEMYRAVLIFTFILF